MESTINALQDSAVALYDKSQYRDALAIYEQLEQMQIKESALFHNMGNCYVRLGELGEARLYFERALVFDPKNADALHNLEWLKLRLTDHLVEPRQELLEWLSIAFRGILETQVWGILSWMMMALTIALLVWRKFKAPINWRIPLTTTVVSLLLLLISWISVPKNFVAINTATSSYGYSEPYKRGKRVVLLSEGSAGRLIKENDGWFYIELGDGRTAWFSAEEWARVLHYPMD